VTLDLATLELGPHGQIEASALWLSPAGDRAVGARPVASGPDDELWLVRLDGRPVLEERLGLASSAPSWSADGQRLAWCVGEGSVVLSLAGRERRRVPGCHPAFAPDGSLLTRVSAGRRTTVLRDGVPVLDQEDAARVFPGGRPSGVTRVVGHGVTPDGLLAMAVTRSDEGFRYGMALELWRGAKLERTIPVPSYGPAAPFFGLRLSSSPSAGELAIVSPGRISSPRPEDLVAVVDLGSGGTVAGLTDPSYAGLVWSPDGSWLALSTGEEILVYGRGRTAPAYVLPLRARALAWKA
jgi:hypothetical protein